MTADDRFLEGAGQEMLVERGDRWPGGRHRGRPSRSWVGPPAVTVGGAAQGRWRVLLDRLGPKLTRTRDVEVLEAMRTFTGSPDKLSSDHQRRRD